MIVGDNIEKVSKLFRAYRLYNDTDRLIKELDMKVSKLFRAYRLYNYVRGTADAYGSTFQSSFELTGYITYALWKVHEH